LKRRISAIGALRQGVRNRYRGRGRRERAASSNWRRCRLCCRETATA